MKLMSRLLLPVSVGAVCLLFVWLHYIEILPYELIPGSPFDISIIPMMAIFWLIFFILDRNIFRPLYSVMNEREQRFVSADTLYEEAGKKIDATVMEWDGNIREVRDELRGRRETFRAELDKKRSEAVLKTKEEAALRLKEAEKLISDEKEDARKELEAFAKHLAQQFIEKLLGRKCA